MKTSKIGFWTIAAVAASMLAAPVVYSQTERFSASLIGANEVPPINTEGTADFDMTIRPSGITFSLNFSGLSSTLGGPPALWSAQGQRWRDDIPMRWRKSAGLSSDYFRNYHRNDYGGKCHGACQPRHCRG
jgi:hypothetical protein